MKRMGMAKAKQIIGGSLGFPTKMPGTSYGLPAEACVAGAKLAEIPGSVCSICYALRDNYRMRNPQLARLRRLEAIKDPRWADAMVLVLRRVHARDRVRVDLGRKGVRMQKKGGSRFRWNQTGYHRWHDSGDLQSVAHLAAICDIAQRTPGIKHWLPTQELVMVKTYIAGGGRIPSNLVVRVSGIMVDDGHRRAWPLTSSVFLHIPPAGAHVCPAPQQGHECKSCRACWSPHVAHVAYEFH